MPNSSCIAVVDDDADVLRSMGRLFAFHGMKAKTYASAEALLADVPQLRPGCIVADVAMPGLDGLQLQQALHDAGLDLPIVFVTARDDVRSSVEAMRRGAVDFIVKPFAVDDLLGAVGRALVKTRAAAAERANAAEFRERLATLTTRERDVMHQVVNGLMNKQIAAKLGIAEKTVKIHRSRIMHKMAVRSVAELARLAERFGFDRVPHGTKVL